MSEQTANIKTLALAMWPGTYVQHHEDRTEDELHARADQLTKIERAALHYLGALDGALGPLDFATPEEALEELRDALRGAHRLG